MARISRNTQPIFASGASNNGVFGSAADGTKVLSNVLATIMAKPAWGTGWLTAVLGSSKFPPLEEFQSLDYVITTQLAYILQQGIPEYDSGTTYYTNNVVMNPGTYQLYGSVTNNNLGNALSSTANWVFLCDLSAFRLRLSGNANYYVATTGNDSNPGTVGSPWLTIQHAINVIQNSIDLNGFSVNINVAAGTYTGGVVVLGDFTGGQVNLIGDIVTPSNVIISTTSNHCIACNVFGSLNVAGFKLQTTTSGDCIRTGYLSYVNLNGKMEFGACANYHMHAFNNSQIIANNAYTISGGAQVHHKAEANSVIENDATTTTTITGTPAFSIAFAYATDLGCVLYQSNTFSGSATGVRYSASLNGVVSTNGGGATYLPGNSAGSTATGGQYS